MQETITNNNPESAKYKFKALKSKETAYFFEQLSMFTTSGIPIWESLQIIADNNPKSDRRELYHTLYLLVADGMFFSQAMDMVGCFPDYALGMIEVSEQTGRVDEVCKSLASYYRDKDKLSSSMKSSVVYPLCMAGMVFVVIFVLLVQVMPIFEQVFTQLGLSLNSVSSGLLGIGQVLNSYALYFLLGFVGILLIFFILSITPFGKKFLDKLYDSAPVTKKLSMTENANRFAFSMALILDSGLDIISALEFSSIITGSDTYKKKIQHALDELNEGESLDSALIVAKVFDSEYNGLITAGAKSGTSGKMFMSIADKYYEASQKQMNKILSIIEPALVAFLCLMVGMVMLSVMLPLVGILSGM